MNNIYGCLPPKTDVRDYKFESPSSKANIPTSFKVSSLPRIKNQGSVCSCVAHASSSILEYHANNDGNSAKLSTNFIYGIQKQLCGHEGSGMYLRDACKIVKTYGDMLEEDCKGNKEVPEAHTIAEDAIKDEGKVDRAKEFKINSYVKCKGVNDIKLAIMNYGPVLASVKWYNTFYCNDNNILSGEQSGDFGYHAIMLYGWDENGFLAQNSWGKSYGKNGRFILPYEIDVREAWQWVDAEAEDIVKPSRGPIIDILYKIVNAIINFFNSIKEK